MGAFIVSTGRSALLAILVAFSLIVLGINANFLNLAAFLYQDDDDDDDDSHGRMFVFEITGVAVAILTLLTVIPVLIMNYFSRRSVASTVLFEIGWVSILMILWAVTAGQTSGTSIPDDGCSSVDDDLLSFCNQFQAVQAFSWLNFILLLLWLITVIVVGMMAYNRGHTEVWKYPLADATVPNISSPPPAYVQEQNNTVLMAQHPGREMLLGQFGLGSTHVPTSSLQLTALQDDQRTLSPLGQGRHQITPIPEQGKQQTTNTLPQA